MTKRVGEANQTDQVKWISATERLPEDARDVLITVRDLSCHPYLFIGCYLTRLSRWVWPHCHILGNSARVVAWAELPKPWEER